MAFDKRRPLPVDVLLDEAGGGSPRDADEGLAHPRSSASDVRSRRSCPAHPVARSITSAPAPCSLTLASSEVTLGERRTTPVEVLLDEARAPP